MFPQSSLSDAAAAAQAAQLYALFAHHPAMAPMEQDGAAAAIRRRPSLMSDFFPSHQPVETKRPGMLAGSSLDSSRRPSMGLYTPLVESISPTPDEEPCDAPGKKMISEKLEKVERETKLVSNQINQFTKRKQELEEAASPDHDDRETEPNENEDTPSVFERIYAENRKRAAESRARLATLFPIAIDVAVLPTNSPLSPMLQPLYHEPHDVPIIRENSRKHEAFRSTLITYVRRLRQTQEMRERYITDRYNTLMVQWRKKNERWEKSPKKLSREAKHREIFEKTFPELKRQREERERSGRISLSTGNRASELPQSQSQEDEERKMRYAAIVPPLLLDQRSRERNCFDNRNGLVAFPLQDAKRRADLFFSCWTEDEKRIFKERLLQYGKNFAAVSLYLEHKDVKDCVWYYYLTKKREGYKQQMGKRRRKPVKGYKAPAMPRLDEHDATLASVDAPGMSVGDQQQECAVCKTKIESNANPGRVLTRGCYETYGLDPENPNANDLRVCQKCRLGILKTKYARCGVGSCTTARRKVKPSRAMPIKLRQLTASQRAFFHYHLRIPNELNKCCSGCHKRITRKLEMLINGELDVEMSAFLSQMDGRSRWSSDDCERLRNAVALLGDRWIDVAQRLLPVRYTPQECREQYEKLLDEQKTGACGGAGIESEEEENSDEEMMKSEPVEEESDVVRVKVEETHSSGGGESNATLSADESCSQDATRSALLYKPRFRALQPPTAEIVSSPSLTLRSFDVQSVVTGIVASEIERAEESRRGAIPATASPAAVLQQGPPRVASVSVTPQTIQNAPAQIAFAQPARAPLARPPPQAAPTSSSPGRGSLTQGTPISRGATMVNARGEVISGSPFAAASGAAQSGELSSAAAALHFSPLLLSSASSPFAAALAAAGGAPGTGAGLDANVLHALQAQLHAQQKYAQAQQLAEAQSKAQQQQQAQAAQKAAQMAQAQAQAQAQARANTTLIQAQAQQLFLHALQMGIGEPHATLLYQQHLSQATAALAAATPGMSQTPAPAQSPAANAGDRAQAMTPSRQLVDDFRSAVQMGQMIQQAEAQRNEHQRQLQAHQQRLQQEQAQALISAQHADDAQRAAIFARQLGLAAQAERQKTEFINQAAVAQHHQRSLNEYWHQHQQIAERQQLAMLQQALQQQAHGEQEQRAIGGAQLSKGAVKEFPQIPARGQMPSQAATRESSLIGISRGRIDSLRPQTPAQQQQQVVQQQQAIQQQAIHQQQQQQQAAQQQQQQRRGNEWMELLLQRQLQQQQQQRAPPGPSQRPVVMDDATVSRTNDVFFHQYFQRMIEDELAKNDAREEPRRVDPMPPPRMQPQEQLKRKTGLDTVILPAVTGSTSANVMKMSPSRRIVESGIAQTSRAGESRGANLGMTAVRPAVPVVVRAPAAVQAQVATKQGEAGGRVPEAEVVERPSARASTQALQQQNTSTSYEPVSPANSDDADAPSVAVATAQPPQRPAGGVWSMCSVFSLPPTGSPEAAPRGSGTGGVPAELLLRPTCSSSQPPPTYEPLSSDEE